MENYHSEEVPFGRRRRLFVPLPVHSHSMPLFLLMKDDSIQGGGRGHCVLMSGIDVILHSEKRRKEGKFGRLEIMVYCVMTCLKETIIGHH